MPNNKINNFFLKHDCNASTDERIVKIRSKHGYKGYGIYWAICEKISDTSDGYLENDIDQLKVMIGYFEDDLLDIFNTMLSVGLFHKKGNKFFSDRMLDWIKQRQAQIKGGSEGGKKGWINRRNLTTTPPTTPPTSYPYTEKRREEERREIGNNSSKEDGIRVTDGDADGTPWEQSQKKKEMEELQREREEKHAKWKKEGLAKMGATI